MTITGIYAEVYAVDFLLRLRDFILPKIPSFIILGISFKIPIEKNAIICGGIPPGISTWVRPEISTGAPSGIHPKTSTRGFFFKYIFFPINHLVIPPEVLLGILSEILAGISARLFSEILTGISRNCTDFVINFS